MSSTLTLSLRHSVRRVTQCPALSLILWSMGLPTELAPRATGVVSLARQYIIDLNFADRWRFSNAHFQRVPTHVFEGVAVGAVYDRPRCHDRATVGGHRPPLQLETSAKSCSPMRFQLNSRMIISRAFWPRRRRSSSDEINCRRAAAKSSTVSATKASTLLLKGKPIPPTELVTTEQAIANASSSFTRWPVP